MFFTRLFQSRLPYAWAWTLSHVLVDLVFELVPHGVGGIFYSRGPKDLGGGDDASGPECGWCLRPLQTFADAFKFMFKEVVFPCRCQQGDLYPCARGDGRLAFAGWAVVPLADGWVVADINVGILYLFAVSSLGVYGIIMGGWASN